MCEGFILYCRVCLLVHNVGIDFKRQMKKKKTPPVHTVSYACSFKVSWKSTHILIRQFPICAKPVSGHISARLGPEQGQTDYDYHHPLCGK